MDIPESCDVLLGMPWFRDVNPNVDWSNLKITPRNTALKKDVIALNFLQTVKYKPAMKVGGRRYKILHKLRHKYGNNYLNFNYFSS